MHIDTCLYSYMYSSSTKKIEGKILLLFSHYICFQVFVPSWGWKWEHLRNQLTPFPSTRKVICVVTCALSCTQSKYLGSLVFWWFVGSRHKRCGLFWKRLEKRVMQQHRKLDFPLRQCLTELAAHFSCPWMWATSECLPCARAGTELNAVLVPIIAIPISWNIH